MKTPRLLLYARELPLCTRYQSIFEREFDLITALTQEDFLREIQDACVDVAVICYCWARDEEVPELLELAAMTGPIPAIACCMVYNPDFIRTAAQGGIDHFLLCDMDPDRVREHVLSAIGADQLLEFLESQRINGGAFSPHLRKMVQRIIHAFPRRLTTRELASLLGITSRRVQMIWRESFNRSFTEIMRRIWVYHALTMMQNTNLDNVEIAMHLGYQDESSLARIFRKELGYNPNAARRRLITDEPRNMLS